eukprot:gene1244-1822_t
MSTSTKPSVLDNLGEEMTAILSPVSLCMAFCVFLVRLLTPDGVDSDEAAPSIGTVYYQEQEEDSSSAKFGGALINALIFVAFITVMTFVIFLLFKYHCTKFIWGYMGFAGFSIFAGLGQGVMLQELDIALDWITYTVIVWNFSVVGTLAVFFWEMPISLKQGYLIFIGAITAFYFTRIPEWTTWLLLVMMALYDLAAVLTPVGPLRSRTGPASLMSTMLVPVFPMMSATMAGPGYTPPVPDSDAEVFSPEEPSVQPTETHGAVPLAADDTCVRSEDLEEPLIGSQSVQLE